MWDTYIHISSYIAGNIFSKLTDGEDHMSKTRLLADAKSVEKAETPALVVMVSSQFQCQLQTFSRVTANEAKELRRTV